MENGAIKMGMAAVAICVFAAGAAWGQGTAAQSAPAKLEFEVASVRPVQPTAPEQLKAGLSMDGSQAHFAALSIKNLLSRAYDVQQSMISGPDWVSSQRYDISAKLPDGATMDQIPQMLQSLLAERFGVKFHRESKLMPAYALMVGKPPLALKEAAADAGDSASKGSANVAVSGSAQGVFFDLGNGSSANFANNQFEFKKVTMDEVAAQLARYMDRPVVNQTGLTGKYDLTLPLMPEDYRLMLIRVAVNSGVSLPPQAMAFLDSSGPPTSLFDAVEKEGLRLDSKKLPVDTIVVDSALQTPTEN